MIKESFKTYCKAYSPNSPFGCHSHVGCHSHEKGNLYRFPIESGMTNRNGSARERTQYFRLNANQHGFTLIEMMIALVLSLIVISGVYEVFTSQQKAYRIQDQVAEMQQNARVAMDMMARSIRSAGYDPRDQNLFGFTGLNTGTNTHDTTIPVATNQEIYFTKDTDDGGTVGAIDNNWEERVGFKIWDTDGDGNLDTLQTALIDLGTGAIFRWQALAENITTLAFTYTYADGEVSHNADGSLNGPPVGPGLPDNTDTDNTNDFEDIRIIQISVTARTAREDPGYTHPTAGDGYRRRTLTANVRPRNLGL